MRFVSALWRHQTTLSVLLSSLAAVSYAGGFVLLHPIVGDVAAALAVVPVGLVGWLHGLRPAIAAGALSLVVTVGLFAISGDAQPFVPGVIAGATAALAGVAIGRARDLGSGHDSRAFDSPSPRRASEAAAADSSAATTLAAGAQHAGWGALFDSQPVVSCVSRPSDDVVVEANETLLKMLGLSKEAVIGRTVVEIGLWSDSQAWQKVRGQLRQHGSAEGFEFSAATSSGKAIALVGSASVVRLGGEPRVVHCALPAARPQPAVESSPRAGHKDQDKDQAGRELTLRVDPALVLLSRIEDGLIIEASQSLLALVGASREEFVGRRAPDIGPLADAQRREIVLEMLRRHGSVRNVEFQLRDRNGAMRDLLGSVALMEVDGAECVVTSALDLTERLRRERALVQRALYDEASGVANAATLRDQLERALTEARRVGGSVALVVVDVDGLDEIRDSFGPSVAAEALRQAASRLTATVRPGDTVARIGSGRFALALPGCEVSNAREAARAFLHALRPALQVGDMRLGVHAIAGVAAFPQHAEDGAGLIERGEAAIAIARRTASSVTEYSAADDRRPPIEGSLTAELADAIAGGRLTLEYQPQLEVRTARITAVEALVRWRHPVRGLLGPVEFVPLAERAGLMRPLTRWVLRHALTQCRAWRQTGLELRVVVNLSARDLADPDLPDVVVEELRATSLSPSALVLDVPESALAYDPTRAAPVLDRLRRTGVTLALDDAGTAYSPLGQLSRLGLRQVKIAAVYMAALHRTPAHAGFVRAMIEACHTFGCEALAEGVEDEETLRLLREMGCDLVQGYLFARPMPANAVPGWMARLGGSELAGLRQRLSQGSR